MRRRERFLNLIIYILIVIILILFLLFFYYRLAKKEDTIINNNDNKTTEENYNNGDLRTYTVHFHLNGASNLEVTSLKCTIDNNRVCYVGTPNATRTNGTVLGYSRNPDDTIPAYKMNDEILVTEDMELYVISYRVNVLHIEDDGLDYLAKNDIFCSMYNKDTRCKVIIPAFNKIGYENKGYSTSSRSLTGFIYPNQEYYLTKDVTLYPIYNYSSRLRSVNIKETKIVNDSFIEIGNNCDNSIAKEYLGYLEDIKNKIPYLLFGNKISFLYDTDFDDIWGSQYVGMNYGPRSFRAIDVRCSKKYPNDFYGTIVHELGHSWDYYYSTRLGKNITSQNDIINLFNKYSKEKNRPFREYSYSSIYEFFADMVKHYYFKYLNPRGDYKNDNYPEDIKETMEKYICIAKNNYEEDKCR